MEPLALSEATIIALHPDGRERVRWGGALLCAQDGPDGAYLVAATWQRGVVERADLRFEPGDILCELFFTDRCYNIFCVWGKDGRRKGYYVNLTTPVAVERAGAVVTLRYTDLALDWVVTPAAVTLLDDADFQALVAERPSLFPERVRVDGERLRQRLSVGPGAVAQATAWLEQMFAAAAAPLGGLPLLQAIARYGVPLVHEAKLPWQGDLTYWRRLQAQGDRSGEAIYVLQGPDGRTWLHTKTIYPERVFRLPGGGVRKGEDPVAAAVREAYEETGLETTPRALLALGSYHLLQPGAPPLVMPNYIVLLEPLHAHATPQASPEEGIVEWRALPWQALDDAAQALLALPAEWQSWGRYRAWPHQLARRAIADRALHW